MRKDDNLKLEMIACLGMLIVSGCTYRFELASKTQSDPDTSSDSSSDTTSNSSSESSVGTDTRDTVFDTLTESQVDTGSDSSRDWYPDCDDDGEFSASAITAEDAAGANAAFDCADGADPDGGWSATAGSDCDDEDNQTAIPSSCLEVLNCYPSATDGTYDIDPDGHGGNAPFMVNCDMANGGWTVIYTEDFASGDASGWEDGSGVPSPVDTTSPCALYYSEMLGGYEVFAVGASTVQTFDLLNIPHAEVSVRLDYLIFDSWDGEYAIVSVDDAPLYNVLFDYRTGAVNACGGAWGDLGAQAVALQSAHSAAKVTVQVTSTLNSDATDESFGVDNVAIRIR